MNEAGHEKAARLGAGRLRSHQAQDKSGQLWGGEGRRRIDEIKTPMHKQSLCMGEQDKLKA
jgi:hypothetical protein